MQQTMGNYKLDFKSLFIILIAAFLFTSCNKIINILNSFGIIPPQEQRLELQLEKQVFDKPFTFADYCKEGYDSIFLAYPYFNTEKEGFVNLKMSDKLRRVCNSNSNFDSLSTLLFVKNGKVEAYTEIENWTAVNFSTRDFEKHYIFPFKQKFILDKERNVHLYKE